MGEGIEPKNLTGVWNGLYSYSSGLSVSFVATLIDGGSALSGATHEPNVLKTGPGGTLYALLAGTRRESTITLVKTYDEAGTSYYYPVSYEGVLNGTSAQTPRARRGIEALNAAMGEALGKLYVERYFPASAKAEIEGMVGSIKGAFAARIKEETTPLSTLFYLPPTPNVTYSAGLMAQAERMFVTGKVPCPIERTLLTTGLVAAGMQSLAEGQRRIETPHLAVRYRAPRESTFLRA